MSLRKIGIFPYPYNYFEPLTTNFQKDQYKPSSDVYNEGMLEKVKEKWFPDCNLMTARIRIPLRSPKEILDNMNKQMTNLKEPLILP